MKTPAHPKTTLFVQGRFMAVDFSADLQQELNYFAGPKGLGVDGIYTDCTRTTSEWLALLCVPSPPPPPPPPLVPPRPPPPGANDKLRAAQPAACPTETSRENVSLASRPM